MAPCGGLASTADDLARWSGFVADPDPRRPLPRHPGGDVPAAGAARRRALDRRHGPGLLPDPLRHRTHLGRPHRRHARSHHRRLHPPRVSGTGAHRADEQHLGARPAACRDPAWPTTSSARPGRAGALARRHRLPEEIAGPPRRLVHRGRAVRVLGRGRAPRGPPPALPATSPPSVFEPVGAGRLPHRLGPGARRAAARHPRHTTDPCRASLGDVPVHEGAARPSASRRIAQVGPQDR